MANIPKRDSKGKFIKGSAAKPRKAGLGEAHELVLKSQKSNDVSPTPKSGSNSLAWVIGAIVVGKKWSH